MDRACSKYGKKRSAFRILVGKLEGKGELVASLPELRQKNMIMSPAGLGTKNDS
jgi:hypothetical protein